MEAYICLAARFIQFDPQEAGAKLKYTSNYFHKHFTESNYNFAESITYSYRNPIQLKTVARWMNHNIPSSAQRSQIIYFLAGLCVIDGDFNGKELGYLRKFSDLLNIPPKDFDSIIGIYYQKEAPKQKVSRPSKRKLCCQILGVSENASFDEIKKAYRSLVKMHHPDKFSTASEEHRKLAKERFLEIQKAYEYLERI